MRILELFSGTASFSNACKKRGHETFTIDNDPQFKPDLCMDILDLDIDTIIDVYDVPQIIWASPPCQCFSSLNSHIHFDKDRNPLTDKAKKSIALVKHTLELIKELQPLYWFLENPQGLLKQFEFMKYPIRLITYCQYGDFRMKPTHIWGKFPKSMIWQSCHYNDKCHESVKKNTRNGTLSLKNSVERAIIPSLFCDILALSVEHDLRLDWVLSSNEVCASVYGKGRIRPGSIQQITNSPEMKLNPGYTTNDEQGTVFDNSSIVRSIRQIPYTTRGLKSPHVKREGELKI